jgi:hypothetical protein
LETIHDSWGGGNGVLLHSYLLFTKQNHGNYSRLICFSGFSIKWVCAVVAAPCMAAEIKICIQPDGFRGDHFLFNFYL